MMSRYLMRGCIGTPTYALEMAMKKKWNVNCGAKELQPREKKERRF